MTGFLAFIITYFQLSVLMLTSGNSEMTPYFVTKGIIYLAWPWLEPES